MSATGTALILGLGESGLAMARWLAREGWALRVADTRAAPPMLASLCAELPAAQFHAGSFDAALLEGVTLLALSPGLAPERSAARFVGITGTNGKSTTTALLHHLLLTAGIESQAGGNLGPAALSLDILGDDGIYVIEMSSYMLERIATVRFNLAVMLNLSPDHLDRHGDMAGYAAAKAHIFDRQQPHDVAVLGMDDALTRDLRAGIAARCVPVSGAMAQPGGIWAEGRLLRDADGLICDLSTAPALPGAHNAQNAAAVAACALALGLPRGVIAEGLASYPGLPHRQERVASVDGVLFVNDSKATNADSAARALASYDRVVWIAGGLPKADGIAPLAPLFPRIAHAVLIGAAAADFAAVLAAHGVPHTIAGTLDAAMPAALAAAQASGTRVVLLSPACASWDQFSSFEARGDRFRDLAQAMSNHVPGRAA